MKRNMTSEEIVNTTLKHLDLTTDEVISGTRHRDLVYGRQLCMFFLRRYTRMTEKNIGLLFKRDHTTVIYAVRKINKFLTFDDIVKNDVALISTHFQNL